MLHEALPFVSVIMPLYNQVNYVRQALDSVLLQNWPKLELLVIDDGSDDGSADIVREFIDEGNNFVRLIQQPNSGGPAQPRNRGIVESKGSLIAFLDPDDFWLPGKLLHQVEVLQAAPDVAMVFSDAYLIDSVGTILDRYLKRVSYRKRAEKFLIPFERNDTFLTCEGFYVFSSVEVAGPQTSGVIVRRNALDAESECFASDFRVGEDLDLWFRLMEKRRCIFIDLPLHAYRQHAASLMHLHFVTGVTLFEFNHDLRQMTPFAIVVVLLNFMQVQVGMIGIRIVFWLHGKTIVKHCTGSLDGNTFVAGYKRGFRFGSCGYFRVDFALSSRV